MMLGSIMLGLDGLALNAEEQEILQHPAVAGVILFRRNYQDPAQLEQLCAEIRAVRSPPLLIATDQEGGRVQRFREGFIALPPAAALGRCHDQHPAQARQDARDLAWLMASELRLRGVDFSFAPVLDLNSGLSSVIGDRAFHQAPDVVATLGFAWMRGVHDAGMAAVVKHFPGHGSVAGDTHVEIAQDHRDLASILRRDVEPFRHLIRANVEALMPAHVIYSQVDEQPAGYSEIWLKTVLRERLGFHGAILSDDLGMAAAVADEADPLARARRARHAGCDLVLFGNDRAAALTCLQAFDHDQNPLSQLRLLRLHGRGRLRVEEIQLHPRWRQARATCERLWELMENESPGVDPTEVSPRLHCASPDS